MQNAKVMKECGQVLRDNNGKVADIVEEEYIGVEEEGSHLEPGRAQKTENPLEGFSIL